MLEDFSPPLLPPQKKLTFEIEFLLSTYQAVSILCNKVFAFSFFVFTSPEATEKILQFHLKRLQVNFWKKKSKVLSYLFYILPIFLFL